MAGVTPWSEHMMAKPVGPSPSSASTVHLEGLPKAQRGMRGLP